MLKQIFDLFKMINIFFLLDILNRSDRTIQFDHKISAKSLVTNQILSNAETTHPPIWQTPPILRSNNAVQTIKTIKRATELRVKTINGIDWNEFYKSVYLKDAGVPIRGDLVVEKSCHVHEAFVQEVNELPTSTWFTLNTPQDVAAEMYIPRFFFTSNIQTRLVNDIQFGFDIALSTGNNTIEGICSFVKATQKRLKYIYTNCFQVPLKYRSVQLTNCCCPTMNETNNFHDMLSVRSWKICHKYIREKLPLMVR